MKDVDEMTLREPRRGRAAGNGGRLRVSRGRDQRLAVAATTMKNTITSVKAKASLQ